MKRAHDPYAPSPATSSTARILQCTEAEYFADPCATPSLSQSIAHTMLARSPLHAWAEHPRLGNCAEATTTKALDAGQLIHKLLLGAGREIEVVQAPDWRTKAAQQQRDEAVAAGRLPVLEHAFANAKQCTEVVLQRMAEAGVNMTDFECAQSEVSVEWREGVIGGGTVLCRGRMDKLLLGDTRAVVFDVKKIRSAEPRTCARHMVDYGYDIQHAAYTSAVRALRPDLAGRIDFLFVFIEDSQPYAITPARPDGVMREHGESRWHRAVQTWARCLSKNHWPGYAECPISLEAPPWAIAQEMENNHG